MAITKILNIQESEGRNPASHLKNALEYIQNPDKTEECVLVGGINCLPDTAFEQMEETKNIFHKTGKRQVIYRNLNLLILNWELNHLCLNQSLQLLFGNAYRCYHVYIRINRKMRKRNRKTGQTNAGSSICESMKLFL